jgi:hypothetical protein
MNKTDALTEITRAPSEASPEVDRRHHPRYSAGNEVLVCWQDDAGFQCEARAIAEDISASGFGVEIDRSIRLTKIVTVSDPERSLRCAVQHIQEFSNSFLVGLEVLSSSDDTPLAKSLEKLSSVLAAAFAEYEKGS